MDFGLSDADRRLRERIARFCRQQFPKTVRIDSFSRTAWQSCATIGLTGLFVPPIYGGQGLGALSTAIALEAFGHGCESFGFVFALGAHLLSCVYPIWRFGSDEQRQRYLPGLCDGTKVGIHAMTEAESGSDAFAMRTVARPEGTGFRITGEKKFITNATVADVVLVFALTDPGKRFFGGVTAFIVEKGAPGFECTTRVEKLGMHGSEMGHLRFDDVFVARDQILGQLGAGGPMFAEVMDWERVLLSAAHVGTLERLLDQSIARARSRRQFDRPIGAFQAVSHRIADMQIRLAASRLLAYEAAWQLEQPGRASLAAAVAKVFVTEATLTTALESLQMQGASGYLADSPVALAVCDALAGTIYSGTSEVLRNTIARLRGVGDGGSDR